MNNNKIGELDTAYLPCILIIPKIMLIISMTIIDQKSDFLVMNISTPNLFKAFSPKYIFYNI